ncbi:Arc family DNA-binding protein [Agrobacterium sp. 33MFTa1.1]|uniref:Arc family DNA-binding protein n=1 Tax=Agrobacterium TaxID=357 RepID=UPI0009DFA8AA|nr:MULTISPECIES: Arc family DNA-binding protein [Agrobacterium]MCJ2873931.1 Arc family DNA-binding protein [Agrobacterium pusense]QBJ12107.1 Arc family DNA-binding protein [Agrobacterium sp. 33MFTa1.1]WMW55787.1 Arc family DNA-binding protein [Agrobacterium pusense]
MTKRPSAYPVRLPADLKEWLETRSIRNHRSINKELVAVLSAVREGEKTGSGFEKLANPSGIPVDTPLFPT